MTRNHILYASVSLALLTPRFALASPEPKGPSKWVAINVTAELGELGELVSSQVQARVEQIAIKEHFTPTQDAYAMLNVKIRWESESQTDFVVVVISRTRRGHMTRSAFKCVECSATKLLDLTESRITPILRTLYPPLTQAVESPQPVPTANPTHVPSERHEMGTLGWLGVSGLALGGSAVATGTALVIVNQRRIPDRPNSIRHYRASGFIALAGGVAFIAAGTTLLVMDRISGQRRRKIAFAPIATPTHLGAWAQARF